MKLTSKTKEKLSRKVNRDIELEMGNRVAFNRVHKSKKAYDRKKFKKNSLEY